MDPRRAGRGGARGDLSASAPENLAHFRRISYTMAAPSSIDMAAKEAISGYEPHLVFLFGFAEALEIIQTIEQAWVGPNRPYYILSDAALVPDLPVVVAADAALRMRVSGSLPATQNPRYQAFVQHYHENFDKVSSSAEIFGAAGAYDGMFLIAYSAAAQAGKALTGANLASGMERLIPGGGGGAPVIEVGQNGVSQAFSVLQKGMSIDLDGASGPLNFDPSTGDAESDIRIWCVPESVPPYGMPAAPSGVYYDSVTKAMAGAIDPACGWTL